MSELRELQRKLLRDWLSVNQTNGDIYDQIVNSKDNPMNNIDYNHFLDFLLLLHQNNGAVDNELVNNYILDEGSRYQLRRAEEVKRAESADGKREIQLKEEAMRLKEEAMRLKEEAMRLKEEAMRLKEEERRLQEDERRLQEEKKIQEEAGRVQEEAKRLEQIQDLINTTANVLELPSTTLLAQFVDCDQLDLITDRHSVDSYGYGYTSHGFIHYSV
jgi:vacuolar-type H+-ATPase subunit I/STV1